MIKLLTPKTKFDTSNFRYSKALTLITNLIYEYYDPYYKKDFNDNKSNILDELLNFCRKIVIYDEYIYKNTNSSNQVKYFNEFMGLSLPKLYIILTFSGASETSQELLEISNKFYEKVYQALANNEDEEIFLGKDHEEEIETLPAETLDTLKYLEKVIEKKKLFDNSSSGTFIHTRTLDKNELKKKYKNLRRPSNKRILFDKDLLDKKTFLDLNSKDMLNKFNSLAEDEIVNERKNYVIKLFDFFKLINENNKDKEFNIPNISFYMKYCESFAKCYKNYLLKNHFFFFYWTNILLMNFNQEEKTFEKENPIYNKDYFNDLSLIEFTIERFENINLNYNNYENLLYIHFLDSYLHKLDEESRANLLIKIIEKPESRNIFHLLHNILDHLFLDIKNYCKEKKNCEAMFNRCPSSVFEKKINEYDIILKFLGHLSENNDIIKNKMKDYLRLQYNNTKNHNFIIILSEILESFCNDNNRKFITKYYSIIIAIIEFITKCCYGPCRENQDCVVKETHILDFIRMVLKYINYREKKYFDDGIYLPEYKEKKTGEENENNINTYRTYNVYPDERRILSYLKYKLLILLNSLTIGRQKGDKIFDLIHQIIDFEVLASVLIETFKEILIEKNAQENPINFIFEENMLSRTNDLNLYLKDQKYIGNNFIIFEIGTYAYILINTYLENLTRPLDLDTYNRILDIKQRLKKNKCEVKPDYIFINLIDFCKNLVECAKVILSKCGNCYRQKRKDEDFF